MNIRTIEFAKPGEISAALYTSNEIRIKVSVNLETEAVFKLVSTAFNHKGYKVTVPVNVLDIIVKVMFTHPGNDQNIRLIPLCNCETVKESLLR